MCRHCERLVEDVDFKVTMHAFMTRTAANMTRSYREKGVWLPRDLVADDIDITVTATMMQPGVPTLRGGRSGAAWVANLLVGMNPGLGEDYKP